MGKLLKPQFRQIQTLIIIILLLLSVKCGWECVIQYNCSNEYIDASQQCPNVVTKCLMQAGGEKHFNSQIFINCLTKYSKSCPAALTLASCVYTKCHLMKLEGFKTSSNNINKNVQEMHDQQQQENNQEIQ